MITLRSGKTLIMEEKKEERASTSAKDEKTPVEQHSEDEFEDASTGFDNTSFKRLPLPAMPKFDKEDASEWFRRLDIQMHLIGAKTENDKFRTLLSNLDGDLLMEVYSYVADSDSAEKQPFTYAKEKLLARFYKSLRRQLQDLLAAKPSGDLPSVFLNELERKAGANNPALVREIWEDSLPEYMTTVTTAMKDQPVAVVAKAVDALFVADRRRRTTVPDPVAVSPVAVVNTEEISRRLDNLEIFLATRDFKPRLNTRKARNTEQNTHMESTTCYYHRRFGDRARNCLCPKNGQPSTQ